VAWAWRWIADGRLPLSLSLPRSLSLAHSLPLCPPSLNCVCVCVCVCVCIMVHKHLYGAGWRFWRPRRRRYVAVNATHVTVGHERPASSAPGAAAVLETVAFAAASNPSLLAQLSDPVRYPAQPGPTVRCCASPSPPPLLSLSIYLSISIDLPLPLLTTQTI
jgi:hypothetical protein